MTQIAEPPTQPTAELFTTVYADITPGLQAQRQQLQDELARIDGGGVK